eukprot:comp24054_c1_seq1/m.43186 comp24054_c1_seq1/g.43186  ORF comp24054_c1_seq1/g.43186 comp24054_c1_seq1/m.43186 type:complete len:354 (-) comp24054_c1_seq1:1237-2298(-)
MGGNLSSRLPIIKHRQRRFLQHGYAEQILIYTSLALLGALFLHKTTHPHIYACLNPSVSESSRNEHREHSFILFNASSMYTMEDNMPTAEAFCVINGKFSAVGTMRHVQKKCPSAKRRDAMGAHVLPGLIDSHAHLMEQGLALVRVDLIGCKSIDDVIDRLKAHLSTHPLQPGEWLRGHGWDQNLWGGHFPTRWDLDTAFPDTPIYLSRIDGHAGWVNTAGLDLIPKLPDTDPEGGVIVRDSTGQPTGIFKDGAMLLVLSHIPAPPLATMNRALALVLEECKKNGLTGIHEPGVSNDVIELYLQSVDNTNFTIRNYAMRLGINDGESEKGRPTDAKIHRYKDRLTVEAVLSFT